MSDKLDQRQLVETIAHLSQVLMMNSSEEPLRPLKMAEIVASASGLLFFYAREGAPAGRQCQDFDPSVLWQSVQDGIAHNYDYGGEHDAVVNETE